MIHAAKQEFSRAPLYKASITNIVNLAGIPRGSFYQYFENKDDAFFYILDAQTKARRANFVFLLKKYEGDLFDAMTEMFRLTLQEPTTEEDLNFMKNAMLNMTDKIDDAFTRIFNDTDSTEQRKEISQLINKQNLNILEEEELFYIMQIITSVIFRNFVEKFAKNLSDEQAMENYQKEMNLLKNGLYKPVEQK
nr:TetR/AcrR family transcriptional regulator [Virgibacillus natechei]